MKEVIAVDALDLQTRSKRPTRYFAKGNIPWNKGKPMTEESRSKLRVGYQKWLITHPHPRRKRVATKCEDCGKKIEKTPYRMKIRKHNFCSPVCANHWRTIHTRGQNNLRYRHGLSSGSLANCQNSPCQKMFIRRKYKQKYCSRSCARLHQMTIGVKDSAYMDSIRRLSLQKVSELSKLGLFGFQIAEARHKAAIALQKKTSGGTNIERRVLALLQSKKIIFIQQHPIKRGIKINGAPGYYFVDFWIPDYNAIIECDGTRWHTGAFEARHESKDSFLRSSGYNLLHLTDFEINRNFHQVSLKIDDFLNSLKPRVIMR